MLHGFGKRMYIIFTVILVSLFFSPENTVYPQNSLWHFEKYQLFPDGVKKSLPFFQVGKEEP